MDKIKTHYIPLNANLTHFLRFNS